MTPRFSSLLLDSSERRQSAVCDLEQDMPADRDHGGKEHRADGDAAAESGHTALLAICGRVLSPRMGEIETVFHWPRFVVGVVDGLRAKKPSPKDPVGVTCYNCDQLETVDGPVDEPYLCEVCDLRGW